MGLERTRRLGGARRTTAASLGSRDGAVGHAEGGVEVLAPGGGDLSLGGVGQLHSEIAEQRDAVGQGDPRGPQHRAGPERRAQFPEGLDERKSLRPEGAGIAPDQELGRANRPGGRGGGGKGRADEERPRTGDDHSPRGPHHLGRRDREFDVERRGAVGDAKVTVGERRLDRTERETRGLRRLGPALQEAR